MLDFMIYPQRKLPQNLTSPILLSLLLYFPHFSFMFILLFNFIFFLDFRFYIFLFSEKILRNLYPPNLPPSFIFLFYSFVFFTILLFPFLFSSSFIFYFRCQQFSLSFQKNSLQIYILQLFPFLHFLFYFFSSFTNPFPPIFILTLNFIISLPEKDTTSHPSFRSFTPSLIYYSFLLLYIFPSSFYVISVVISVKMKISKEYRNYSTIHSLISILFHFFSLLLQFILFIIPHFSSLSLSFIFSFLDTHHSSIPSPNLKSS